ERDFGRTQPRIIDATEGGALKRGATIMSLAESMKQFCNQPLPKTAPDHPGLQWQNLERCLGSLETRRSEAAQIREIAAQTLPLLQEIRDHLDDQQRANR